ncbi:MAG: hypothetical protein JST93_14270 [Acidobacteria bacterium]|nr:hypothetical protein [Acidobacteriota bacterium]
MSTQTGAPSGLRKLGKEFVSCSQTLGRWSSISWIMSPWDSFRAFFFRSRLEKRQRTLSLQLLDAYKPLLAEAYSFAAPSHPKAAWQQSLWSDLLDSAMIPGPESLSIRLWRILRIRMPAAEASRWEKKFLLFPYFAEMRPGDDKSVLWILVYHGGGEIPPGNQQLLPLDQAYSSFLDILNRYYEELSLDARFSRSELQAIESRNMDQIDLWLLVD